MRLDAGRRQVLAIGVTSPLSEPVLDIRVWRLGPDLPNYIATESVTLPGQSVEVVLLAPPDRTGDRTWPPGSYRVDALTGRGITRVRLELAGESSDAGRSMRSGPAPSDADLAGILRRLDAGALALSLPSPGMPTIVCLGDSPGPPLEDAAAWLDLGRGPAVLGGCSGSPVQNPAQALALLLPDGQRLASASLVRLEPEVEDLGVAALMAGQRLALFRPRGGGAPWDAGTYRVDAEWHDGRGDRSGSWLLDVYPRSDRAPLLLEAARRAASDSGRWAVGGLWAEMRRQRPNSAPTDPAALGRTCGGGRLLPAERVVIVGYRGATAPVASVARLLADGSSVEQRAFVERDAVEGALLLAPVGDSVWRPGYYTIRLWPASESTREAGPRTLVFCVGLYEPNGELLTPLGADEVTQPARRRP